MKKEKKTVTVKVKDDDSYKTELNDKMIEVFGVDSETELNKNIAVGFSEAFRELGHQNFDLIVKG